MYNILGNKIPTKKQQPIMNIVDRRAEHLADRMSENRPQNTSHNPVSNPLPWVIQNPYIRKDIEKNQYRHIKNEYSQSPTAIEYNLPRIEIQHNKSVDFGSQQLSRNASFASVHGTQHVPIPGKYVNTTSRPTSNMQNSIYPPRYGKNVNTEKRYQSKVFV